MRHSRWVRRLRRAIPVIVVLLLAGTALVRYLDPMQVLVRLPGSVQGVVISGSKIMMQAPKLSGYTKDSRRYEISAASAAQDVTKPNLIELSSINAAVDAGEGNTIKIVAADGTFDRSSGMLTLTRDVALKSTDGLEMHLQEAVVNTNTNDVVSEKPVKVINQQSTIRSDRFEVSEGGDLILFIGNVAVTLPGSDLQAAPPPPAPAPAPRSRR